MILIGVDIRDYQEAGGVMDPRTDFEKYMDEITKHTDQKIELDIAKEKLEVLVEDHSIVAKSRFRREILLFSYFFFLAALNLAFGFWIALPIFLFAFLRFYGRETLRLSVMITVLTWAVMYLILVVVLGQFLFEGFITQFVIDNWLSD